jgi:hypothetical protein
MFKIFSPSQNKFSNGGVEPTYNKKGKTWDVGNHLKNHLKQRTCWGDPHNTSSYYAPDDVVIEYELVEVRRTPIDVWLGIHKSK